MFSRSDGATALQADLVRALSFSVEQIELEGPEGREPALAGLAGIWTGDKGSVALLVRRMNSRAIERYLYAHPIVTEAELRAAIDEGLAFLEDLGFSMDLPEHVTLGAEARERRLRLWNKLRKIRTQRRPPAPPRPAGGTHAEGPEGPEGPAGGSETARVMEEALGESGSGDGSDTESGSTLPFAQEVAATAGELTGDIDPDEAVTPPTPLDIDIDLRGMAGAPAEPDPREAEQAMGPAGAPAVGLRGSDASRAVLGRIGLVRRRGGAGRPDPIARLLSFF
jgi:hypothetical protein